MQPRRFSRSVLGISLATLGALAGAAQGAAPYRTVALSGEPAPGAPAGVVFSVLTVAEVDDQGRAFFGSTLSGPGVVFGNDEGFWFGDPNAVSLVARKLDQDHGLPAGISYSSFSFPIVMGDGEPLFRANLGGAVTSSDNSGVWAGPPGSTAVVAREGDQAPGLPAGVVYGTLFPPAINAGGEIILRASLTGTGVNGLNNGAIWTGATGSLTLLMREGDAAPDTGAGVTFFALGGVNIGDGGDVAFSGSLTGAGITSDNNQGMWMGAPGSIDLLAREGDPAPGAGPGVQFSSVGVPWISSTGVASFDASLKGTGVNASNDSSIWVGTPGALQLVFREGDQAPGADPGVVFTSLESVGNPLVNESGTVVF